jgi:hypothetical protein
MLSSLSTGISNNNKNKDNIGDKNNDTINNKKNIENTRNYSANLDSTIINNSSSPLIRIFIVIPKKSHNLRNLNSNNDINITNRYNL